MEFRRGFKSEAAKHAAALRQELGLPPHAPLCPWQLAGHLEIPIIPLSQLESYDRAAILHLMGIGRDEFSAVTIFLGRHQRRRAICHNDAHAKTRQAANVAHELAHAILAHARTLMFDRDPIAEAEANWLGPALLVSEEAAWHIAKHGIAPEAAALMYKVSNDVMRMRLNVTGALIRAERLRRRRA